MTKENATVAVIGETSGLWQITPTQFQEAGWKVGHWNEFVEPTIVSPAAVAKDANLWLGYAERGDVCRSLLTKAITEEYASNAGKVASEVVSRLVGVIERTITEGPTDD